MCDVLAAKGVVGEEGESGRTGRSGAADKAAAAARLQLRQSGVPLSMRPWKSIGATAVWSAASVAAPARRSRGDGAIVCAQQLRRQRLRLTHSLAPPAALVALGPLPAVARHFEGRRRATLRYLG